MKILEIDLADECLSGIDNVIDRLYLAVTECANMESATTYDPSKYVSDKYRVTVTVELMEPWNANEGD